MLAKFSLFPFWLFLFSTLSYGHVNEKSQAFIELLSEDEYRITLKVDIVHLLQQQARLSSQNDELINDIRTMTLKSLMATLKSANTYIQENTSVSFNSKVADKLTIQGPTLGEIRQLFNKRNTSFLVNYSAFGKYDQSKIKLSVRLPEIMSDTVLVITKPVQIFIEKGQLSPPILLDKFNGGSQHKINPLLVKTNQFLDFVYQGIVHIIPKGLDHILFILALFLLATKLSTLLWQISAFTLAHTLTLALGIYGIINISSSIVEPLIALSIVYVAIENLYAEKLKQWRLAVIFIFGLLHGLGFAAVLLELGLAPSQFIMSLIAFNIGVEIGQVSVILLAVGLLYWCRNKDWYRQRVIKPASLLIALIGLFWFVERVI